jgi:hypothetical protein
MIAFKVGTPGNPLEMITEFGDQVELVFDETQAMIIAGFLGGNVKTLNAATPEQIILALAAKLQAVDTRLEMLERSAKATDPKRKK